MPKKNKTMILIKIGKTAIYLALFICLLANLYFGWNDTPTCKYEEYADNLVEALVTFGAVVYLTPLSTIYENYVRDNQYKL